VLGVPPVALLEEPPVACVPPVACDAPPVAEPPVDVVFMAVLPPVVVTMLEVPPVDDEPPVPLGALARHVPRKHCPSQVLSDLHAQPTVPSTQVAVVLTLELPPVADEFPPVDFTSVLDEPPVVATEVFSPPVSIDTIVEPSPPVAIGLVEPLPANSLPPPQATVLSAIASTKNRVFIVFLPLGKTEPSSFYLSYARKLHILA